MLCLSCLVPPADDDVYVSRWRLFETDDGLTRLVGYDSLDQGFVSAALVYFYDRARLADTSEGIIYRLIGEPGLFLDVVNVWNASFSDAGAVKDVTERLLARSEIDGKR